MDNEYEKISIHYSMEDIKIENNPYSGQGEGDFDKAFEEIFKKKAFIEEDHEEDHEEYPEIKSNLQSINLIKKEEPPHECQRNSNYSLKTHSKINLNEDINDENNEKINFKLNDGDKDQNCLFCENDSIEQEKPEFIINENLVEKEEEEEEEEEEDEVIKNVEIKKEESSNMISEIEKPNKFRVYSSNDFNIFHPGGNVEFYKQIKEEINEELLELQEDQKKKPLKINKFKIYKEKNKKTKKKAKEKKKRKDKPDDVRKKIKSRFLKTTKNRINQMLKSAKSKELFDFLPQCFICNISKQKNKMIMNMTFKELMSQNFGEDEIKKDNGDKKLLQHKRGPDQKKYDNNVKVLKYLEKNEEISRKSNFNVIGKMTFREIFNEYLKSEEFEKEIEKLKTENNNDKYIKDYIIKAFSFVNYFASST